MTTRWQQTDGGRPCKYCALTADGHQALDRFRADWRRFRDMVDHALAISEKGPTR